MSGIIGVLPLNRYIPGFSYKKNMITLWCSGCSASLALPKGEGQGSIIFLCRRPNFINFKNSLGKKHLTFDSVT
jgi:hypothetical protein